MSSLKKLARIVAANWRITWRITVIYRANAFFFLIFESLFLFSHMFAVNTGFQLSQGQINGWTTEYGLLMVAIYVFSHHIFLVFFLGALATLEQVGGGSFDFTLLKPQPPLLTMWASSPWIPADFPNLCIAGGILAYLLTSVMPDGMALSYWIQGFMFIGLAILIRVGLSIMCFVPIFFAEKIRSDETFWSLVGVANFPSHVFPRLLQQFFTFVIPVMLISTVPVEAFLGLRSPYYLAGCFAAGCLFVWLSVRFFNWGLQFYKSVNAGV